MKLKTNFNKIMSVFILIIMFSFIGTSNIIYAKTNKIYSTPGEVGSIDVEQAISDAPILDSIAHAIYALAGFVESIVSGIVSVFTGQKVFPWADRIVFNTMPMLDINFLSPTAGSLFADADRIPTDLGNIVRNIYYIIFYLSVVFFGVVVGIMALKLAISSIASERAKYKQAITSWLLALILVFTAHYLMSFIFFINEKMVEVASDVILSQNVSFNIDVEGMTKDEMDTVCAAIMKEALSGVSYDQTYNSRSSLIFYDPVTLLDDYQYAGYNNPNYGKDIFSIKWGDDGNSDEWGIRKYNDYDDWNRPGERNEWGDTGTYHEAWLRCIMNLYADHEYKVGMDIGDEELTYVVFMDAAYILNLVQYHNLKDNQITKEQFINGIRNVASNINYWCGGSDEQYDLYSGFVDQDNVAAREEHFEKLWKHAQKYYISNEGKYKEEVFSGMADFFKGAVASISLYKNADGEYEVNDFNAIPAILYSIFVIQSIMYFIAYLKRFFFILILALFAPLVIVYDFLAKTVSG